MPLPTHLEAGKLRHRVELLSPTGAQDTFGGTSATGLASFATVWASVEALTGRELFAAQQVVAEVTHRVTMRYMPGVLAKMVVWFDNRQFQIQAVQNPDERKKMLMLLCLERDDSAREPGGSPS